MGDESPSPETRVQRTRLSPAAPRSPLTRRPLGAVAIAATVVAALGIASCATNIAEQKIAELESLPTGLTVQHTPDPAQWREYGRPSRRYTWFYRTTIGATGGDSVTITEFGAFSWSGKRWVFQTLTGKPFMPRDFAVWYRCPGAKVDPGRPCTDPENFTSADSLPRGSRIRWYYIGVTANGQRLKGEAIIHLEATPP